MPVIKSAIKRMRQNQKRADANARVKNRAKATVKEYTKLATSGDTKKAEAMLPQVYSQIDRAAKRGIYHRNRAARMKARLAKLLQSSPNPQTTKSKSAQKKAATPKKSTKPR